MLLCEFISMELIGGYVRIQFFVFFFHEETLTFELGELEMKPVTFLLRDKPYHPLSWNFPHMRILDMQI